MTEDDDTKRAENEIRGRLQEIGRMVKGELPQGWGFILLVSSIGPKGVTLYLSTINRPDALQVMREFVAAQREERNWLQEMPDLEITEEFEQWWVQQNKRRQGKQQPLKEWCRDAFLAGRASA